MNSLLKVVDLQIADLITAYQQAGIAINKGLYQNLGRKGRRKILILKLAAPTSHMFDQTTVV